VVGKIVLLCGAIPVAAAASPNLDPGPFDERWYLEVGWIEVMTSSRVMLGAAMTVLALRAPATAADAWFEFAFRRGRPDYEPVPVLWFGATAAVLAVGSFLGLVVVAGLGYRLAGRRDDWPLVFGLTAIAVFVAVAVWERWVRQSLPSGETTLERDSEVAVELRSVANRVGMGEVQFGTTPNVVAGDPTAEHAPNAYSAGLGRNRRVVLTDALLDQDRPTRDFVVAHELTHVRHHHVLLQSVAGAVVPVSAIVVTALSVRSRRPWANLGLDPLDPVGLPLMVLMAGVVLLVLGPLLGWLSRALERAADSGAVAVMGPLPVQSARALYVETTADLDPPWWARLYAHHPAPAERLEFLARVEAGVANRRARTRPSPAQDLP
jgi:Zn-dependent protease with chaperone function